MALILIPAALIPACGGGGGGSSSAGSGVVFSDPGIETFPDEGNAHVPVGTVITYNTDPPTSGSHYPDPQPGGFYTSPIAAGFLVHSLEHGGVVIYLDSAHVSKSNVDKLKKLAADHPGTFAQVVVVPRDDSTYPLILTAWTHRLRLMVYDQTRIDGFLTLFLGNGPEKD
jgi:hypothetical protein